VHSRHPAFNDSAELQDAGRASRQRRPQHPKRALR
jgi:hypothetical protein